MKVTIDGTVIEGTPEEIKEMMTLMGAEFPMKETEEDSEVLSFEVGDKVKALADGENGDILEGETAIIEEILDDSREKGDPYYIEGDTDSAYDYFRPQDLEKVSEEGIEEETEEEIAKKVDVYKPKLKVGDYAKIVGVHAGHRFPIGEIVKISKVNPSDYKAEYLDGSDYWYVRDEEVESHSEKVKPGDIVVITGESEWFSKGCENNVGDIGKIIRESDGGSSWKIQVPGGPDTCNCTHKTEVRAATDEEKAQYEQAIAEAQFKVGDYAKVITDVNEHREGDIVKITGLESTLFDFHIDRIGKGVFGYIDAINLEKISEGDVKFAELGRKPGEFEKGDIVRVTNAESSGHIQGDISEIINVEPEGTRLRMFEVKVVNDSDIGGWLYPEDIELIAPVERRVDKHDA